MDGLIISIGEQVNFFKKTGFKYVPVSEIDVFKLKDFFVIGFSVDVSSEIKDFLLLKLIRNISYSFDKKYFILWKGPWWGFLLISYYCQILHKKGLICIGEAKINGKFNYIDFLRQIRIRQ